ncbi:hypothetical protein [Thiomonas sp.]
MHFPFTWPLSPESQVKFEIRRSLEDPRDGRCPAALLLWPKSAAPWCLLMGLPEYSGDTAEQGYAEERLIRSLVQSFRREFSDPLLRSNVAVGDYGLCTLNPQGRVTGWREISLWSDFSLDRYPWETYPQTVKAQLALERTAGYRQTAAVRAWSPILQELFPSLILDGGRPLLKPETPPRDPGVWQF